jgi:glycine/D-amino acid oxidase-like deaminating enzyme/nitrite reductase/ring-hydroxylating ferredoxin subunit
MEQHPLGRSVWLDGFHIDERPGLHVDRRVDVCVVGAGIAGMTTAYLLAKEGRNVIVLDGGPIGGGMTGFTTAHLTHALDDRYFELERYHGEEGARLAADSHTVAIDCIEGIVRDEGIDCDFRRVDGYLFGPPGDTSDEIDREYDAVHRAGLTRVEKLPGAPIDGFATGPALRFPDQGQFHPLKYLNGLARAIERLGGSIHCRTYVKDIRGGQPAVVETREGALVTADDVVVATNAPINNLVAIHTKQAPYTTYVVGIAIPRDGVVPALYWDTRERADQGESGDSPYHYVRMVSGADGVGDILIIGGEDHKSGQAHDGNVRFARLELWARERWPSLGEVVFRWSGQVMEPNDGLAFIGRNPMDKSNIYVVTGDSGNGMTHGTIAGLLLSDLIQGRENAWASLYDPGRVKFSTTSDFLKENANVVSQYAKGYLGPAEVEDEESIMAGEGGVVRHGAKRIAVYRDEGGVPHHMSAVCPHLGCVVSWNGVEKTWDCPCHGSRFDAMGEVVNGPANQALEAIDPPAPPSTQSSDARPLNRP